MTSLRDEREDWPCALRVAHLPGGLRAINALEEVTIVPGDRRCDETTIFIMRYPKLIWALAKLRLRPIGVDFFIRRESALGYMPPDWRPMHIGVQDGYPAWNAADLWSCLANAGFETNRWEVMDVARRITFMIRASTWRLRDLSESYARELGAEHRRGRFEAGKQYESPNSFFIYLATHALLVDMCTLRDYLAEFVGQHLLGQFARDPSQPIRTMGALRKQILRDAAVKDELARDLLRATDRDGWLTYLGHYRDLVVHSTPLAEATHRGFLLQRYLPASAPRKFPSICFPIPADPSDVVQRRSRGVMFANPREWLESHEDTALAPDALDYSAEVLEKMMLLAHNIGKRSPVPPKRKTLTEKDLRGPIRIARE